MQTVRSFDLQSLYLSLFCLLPLLNRVFSALCPFVWLYLFAEWCVKGSSLEISLIPSLAYLGVLAI